MPKYLIRATYTAQGLAGLRNDKASGRRQSASSTLESVGGKLEAFYFVLGEDDVIIIADMPDNTAAAAVALAVSASGAIRTTTTALLTVEETDAALAKNVNFRPPGK